MAWRQGHVFNIGNIPGADNKAAAVRIFFDLLKQIRSADPDIPFLMVTGRADQESVMEAKIDGVSAYIAKPYSVKELERKLLYLQNHLMV